MDLYGNAKLADFGVAGQLSDTMSKRNTVIGTPYWMAPEIIQEIGYDCTADVWSLGITAIELADFKPPYSEFHPMRALFMIPTKPSPTVSKPEKFSSHFNDFVAKCLEKDPSTRPNSSCLLQHDMFIKKSKQASSLVDLIALTIKKREKIKTNDLIIEDFDQTMYQTVNTSQYTLTKKYQEQTQTLKPTETEHKTTEEKNIYFTVKTGFVEDQQVSQPINKDVDDESMCNTMIINYETLVEDETDKKAVKNSSELGQKIQKEIACLGKGTLENNLTKEDIQERLNALSSEMNDSISQMTMKYSRNKEKIFNAIQFKNKNHSIF